MTNHHTYKIGEVALPCDIDTSRAANAASKMAVESLNTGDGCFIRRSDKQWRYAIASEVHRGSESSPPYIMFSVTTEGSTKKVGVHHWSDRLRPLKRPNSRTMKTRIVRGISGRYGRDKHNQRRSSHTAQTERMNSESTLGVPSPRASHKQSDDESGDTNSIHEHEPVVEEAFPPPKTRGPRQRRRTSLKDMFNKPAIDKPAQDIPNVVEEAFPPPQTRGPRQRRRTSLKDMFNRPAIDKPAQDIPNNVRGTRTKRRESLKGMATGFIKRFSRETDDPDEQITVPINQLANDITQALDELNMEQTERSSSPLDAMVGPEDTKEGAENDVPPTGSDCIPAQKRKTRQGGGSNLTTSGLFKKLMIGVDLEEHQENDTCGVSNDFKAECNTDLVEDIEKQKESYIHTHDIAFRPGSQKVNPKRNRRATFHEGSEPPTSLKLAANISRGGRSQRNVIAGTNKPTASAVMKNAFAQLMEEKMDEDIVPPLRSSCGCLDADEPTTRKLDKKKKSSRGVDRRRRATFHEGSKPSSSSLKELRRVKACGSDDSSPTAAEALNVARGGRSQRNVIDSSTNNPMTSAVAEDAFAQLMEEKMDEDIVPPLRSSCGNLDADEPTTRKLDKRKKSSRGVDRRRRATFNDGSKPSPSSLKEPRGVNASLAADVFPTMPL